MQQLQTVIPAIFNRIRAGATFMSVMGYRNNYNEVSNFGIVFHVDYINAVKKSLDIWRTYQPKTPEEKIAKLQLIESFEDTLKGQNWRATSAHVYTPIADGDNNLIKGVKWFLGGEIHLWGFVVHRVVVTPGRYPETRSSRLVQAKNALRRMTPLSKFRQYKLVNGSFDHIGVEKLTLTQKDLIKELLK